MTGDKTQWERDEALNKFRNGRIQALVATDVAARGLDVKGVTCVVNFDMVQNIEDYVHRIGRTARAERTGEAITCINPKQVKNFMDIEKLIEKEVPKLGLPKGFSNAPEYKILSKNKNWKNLKKRKPTSLK